MWACGIHENARVIVGSRSSMRIAEIQLGNTKKGMGTKGLTLSDSKYRHKR